MSDAPVPYNLRPKVTQLAEGPDDSLEPSEAPVNPFTRFMPPNSWPQSDTSRGSDGPPDAPLAPPGVDPSKRTVPPFVWPSGMAASVPNRAMRETGFPPLTLDPDIALWPRIAVSIWPFTGPPTEGTWPTGWFGIDNTGTPYVCIMGGEPGLWSASGASSAGLFDPRSYGARYDGVHDDGPAVNAALDAAAPTAGIVYIPPFAQILTNEPIVMGPYSPTSTIPVPYPSLVSDVPPGRIGDATDDSAVQFIAGPTFPVGTPLLEVLAPNNIGGAGPAPTGSAIRNLGFKCNGRAAGVYIEQPRMFDVAFLSIDHAATPTGYAAGNGATAAFSVVQLNGTASAYNDFHHICTSYAAQDGFFHNCAGNDRFDNCFDLNATRSAFTAQGFATWTNCHYEASLYGFQVLCGDALNTVNGGDYFGLPTSSGLQVSSNYSTGINNSALFNNVRIACAPTAFLPTSAPIFASGTPVIFAEFAGGEVVAEGQCDFFIHAGYAPAGSVISFDGTRFTGTVAIAAYYDPNNVLRFHNCPGINPVGVVTVAVPATTVAVAAAAYDRVFYIATSSALAAVAISGGPIIELPTTGVVPVRVPAGSTLTPTYASTAPTWVVEGE